MQGTLLIALLFLLAPALAVFLAWLELQEEQAAEDVVPVGSYWRYAIGPNDYSPVRVVRVCDGTVTYRFSMGGLAELDAITFLCFYTMIKPTGDSPQHKD